MPKDKYYWRHYQIRKKWRDACITVVETSNQLRSQIGQMQAFDYTRMNQGSGPMYATPKGSPMIEFTADVLSTARDVLDDTQHRYFLDNMVDQDIEETKFTEELMELYETLGRAFMAREMFPLNKYFTVIKR